MAHEGHEHTLPAGFQKTEIASDFNQPTAVTQTPDGRFFVLEKGGIVHVVKNGATLPTPLITVPANAEGERGLLGIALDPSFASNGYIYLYYVNNSPLEIRVSRFTVSGDTASMGSQQILLKSTQAISQVHHSGTVRFGPDGKLWITIGNNGNNANPQDLTTIHGKVLRINKDGSIPSDNPYAGVSNKKGEIWAYGFRNPFRFSFMNGLPMVGDVGEATYEELNLIQKGGNYGWPNAEGPCTACSSINPYFSYPHNGGSASITAGVQYKATTGAFPASYTNAFFYGDYANGFIRYLSIDANGNLLEDKDFDPEAGTTVDMFQGTDGAIYFLNIYPGALMKIAYTGGNVPPTAKMTATPTAGKAPLSVQFSSEGSIDSEGKPLTYLWNFGDSTTATEANPTHIYTQNGTYTAALTVSDGESQSSTISFPITVGKEPPTVTMTSPDATKKYNAGDTISYSATASDEQNGVLPASAYAWTVTFHHQTHIHPFLGPITNTKQGTFVIPTNGEPSAETWYEISLTVTNPQGLATTVKRAIHPNVVTMTFASNPVPGLTFTLDGIPHTTPYTVQGVVGFTHVLDVPTPQLLNDISYDYTFWSQGGNKQQTLITPVVDQTYTVNFNQAGSGTGHIHYRVREFDKNGTWTGKFINGVTAKLTDPTGETVYATETSKTINGQDGWVYFDYQQVGTYSVLTYQNGYIGLWKQTDCGTGGTTTNATITNRNTEKFVAAFQANITISQNNIVWCKDVGLKTADTGNLFFRVRLVEKDYQNLSPDAPYAAVGDINGATVKLTDPSGQTVIKTGTSVKSPEGEDGWVFFKDVPVGTYGIMAYKENYAGFWKQTDCVSYANNASITNSNTDGIQAAWKDSVTVKGGITNYCHDLGLTAKGHWHFRVREMDATGKWTGKFVNGATAKLTTPDGTTVLQTQNSALQNGQDGWVYFDNIESGRYTALVYKTGLSGNWKQTDCGTGGTTANATIQNNNTEGLTAATQQNIPVKPHTITWCTDVGLSAGSATGHIHVRIREFDAAGIETGKFINGATAKLTDAAGTTVSATETSKVIDGQDGWVYFDNVPVKSSYGIMVYKTDHVGLWKQTDCTTGGTTTNATIQNNNTEGLTAAFKNDVPVTADTVTWCVDLGLKTANATATGRVQLRVREFDANDMWTGKFINGAKVKLTTPDGLTVLQTKTSAVLAGEARLPSPEGEANGGQDGWVYFDAPVGSYGVMTYQNDFAGVWKQKDCATNGTTEAATIQNAQTDNKTAAWDNEVAITANQTLWCQDLGLKTTKAVGGRLALRIRDIGDNDAWNSKFLNGVTVKLTTPDGTTVLQTQNSALQNTEEGWAIFDDIPAGAYGVLAYKDGYTGMWKQTDCDTGAQTGASLQNSHTEGKTAAWQEDVSITNNTTTWCKDLGLKKNTVQTMTIVSPPNTASESATNTATESAQ